MKSHSMAWWVTKVVAGLVLVLLLVDYFILQSLANGLRLEIFLVPSWFAQCVVLLGGSVNLYHYLVLKAHNHNIASPNRLVTHIGLLRFIRHPMYLGDLILYSGLFLLAPTYFSLLVLVIAAYALYQQSLVEDKFLANQFSQQFDEWQKKTRLFI